MFLTRIASSIALSLLLFTFLLVTVQSVGAQQPAAAPADQAAINRAIDNGVRYLRSVQTPSGTWGEGTGAGSGKGWGVGYTALAGLALVECGVSISDPGLRRAHAWVKSYIGELDQTYEVSLAILFLDRMGDKRDRRLIQVLASRLIAGQSATGGWGYKVPKLTSGQQEQLLGALRKMNPPAPPPAPSMRSRPSSLGLCIKASEDLRPDPALNFDPEKARAAAIASLPKGMKQLPVFGGRGGIALEADPKDKRNDPIVGTTDNSNTHFAMLAMWAARKHEIPVERSLELLANRFRTSQGGDGTWGYDYRKNGGGGSQAFTCVALLGLAIGHVVDPEVAVTPEKDPRVVNAFGWLSKKIGQPAGTIVGRPSIVDAGGLYYLWAMERIAVLYDVRSLDKKDWYLWGAEILLGHQGPQGNWADGGEHVKHPVLSTSLALLFLKRANLTPDLSRRLVVDPSALTQKVSDTVTPKPPPVTPMPKPPDPVTVAIAPPPREVVTPEPEQPQLQRPTVTQPASSSASTETGEKSSKWPWVLLLVVLSGLFAGCAFLVVKKMKGADDEEEKPRKKKKKKPRPKVEK